MIYFCYYAMYCFDVGERTPEMVKKILNISDVQCGGWIVASYKAFSCFDLEDAAFDSYEATILAGKASELLSSIRSLGDISSKQFDTYRKLARLKPSGITPLVEGLEGLGALAVGREKTEAGKALKNVRSLCTTKAQTFEATAKLFGSLDPSPRARASIEVLDGTLHMPVRESDVLSLLHEHKFEDEAAQGAISDLISFKLINRTREKESGESLIYNPYAFAKNASDSFKVLKSLSGAARSEALSILEHVHKKPGVPFPQTMNAQIISLLAKAGIIDLSGVQVKGGLANKEFPTAPHVWGVLSKVSGGSQLSADVIDDSKLLLNSLRYGEFYSRSSRGRINDPSVLVNVLIQRGQVGPATAIGEDYPLALARGIVSIAESRMYPGRYFMELRKQDIAEAVRDILDQNVILPAGDVGTTEALQRPGAFHSPEQVRLRKELPRELEVIRDSLAFDLRTLRKTT